MAENQTEKKELELENDSEKEPEKEQNKKKETEDTSEETESADKENCKEVREHLLRLAAEFDNYKKRVVKDLGASSDKGKAEIIAKLLPVIDEFELAISNMDIKQEHAKGISLIYSNFISILKSAGLRALDVSGRYDPYKQEIVLVEESDEEEGTIIEVVRKGYAFNEIMLRPASVIVAKKRHVEQTKNKEENKEENKKDGE